MATAAESPGRPADAQARLLLTELREAHDRLLAAMAELDELTRGPVPAKARIIDARWNISRASLARRTLWNRIHAYLLVRATGAAAVDLHKLKEDDRALLRASTAHVSRWTVDSVMKEWAAYCEASAQIRWKMKAAIAAEQRVVYPLLTTSAAWRN